MEAYVARQPIFDLKKTVFAYELLFRDGLKNCVPEIDGDVATSKVLSSSFLTIGIEQVTGGKRAFINFTENLLKRKVPLMFPPETTVVEILEDVRPDPDLIASCRNIAGSGYLMALDDFVFQDDMGPLVELAEIVKVDFRQTPMDEIARLVERLSGYRGKLLAEKVETAEEFRDAAALGFQYFQGYFFSRPEILSGREISGTDMGLLRLVAEINQVDYDFEKIESILSADVSISYKLLRYINSAFFRRRTEITSIKHAMRYLGQEEMRRFVSLIALSRIADAKPDELVRAACIKAKFCERLTCEDACRETPGEVFTLGLFANIDAILDRPMAEIMRELPLADRIKAALTDGSNDLGLFLSLSKHYEKGEWQSVCRICGELGIQECRIPPIYTEACQWADSLAG